METGLYEKAIWAFQDKVRVLIGKSTAVDYTAEPEIRGLTVRTHYDKGRLTHATTIAPGGGFRDVTGNIRTILTVPLVLSSGRSHAPVPERLEAVGVVYLEREAFADVNTLMAEAGRPPFSDSRDAAAAGLLHEDPKVAARMPLSMFCCEITRAEGVTFLTHYEAMIRGQELGLRVNRPYLRIFRGLPEVLAYFHELREMANTLPYPVDGAIIRVNRMDLRKDYDPRQEALWSLALRFQDAQERVL